MKEREQENNDVVRPETPLGEDPARLNDLNAEQVAQETLTGTPWDAEHDWDQNKPMGNRITDAGQDSGTQQPLRNQQPSPPQSERDGEMQPQDQSRDGNPSFVESNVANGGQAGKYGEDSYQVRRNEKQK